MHLEESEQKARRPLPFSDASEKQARHRAEELEVVRESAKHYKQQLEESQDEITNLESYNRRLDSENRDLRSANQDLISKNRRFSQRVSDVDQRVAALAKENGTLDAQLKALRHGSKAKHTEPPIDAFSHRLDQVSEASVKSGVESLNDTLDNLVTEIIDKGEQVVQKNTHLVSHCPEPEQSTPLLHALAQNDLTSDNRGLLLDAMLHDLLHTELYELLFSGDVASQRFDPRGSFQSVFDELPRKAEPWTVVQRWRAITATTLFALYHEALFADSLNKQVDSIVALLAWAHRLPREKFEDMSSGIHSGLVALYSEANELGILVRRDILSVRMSIVSANIPVFDPTYVNSVWPEMGAAAGDEVVGQYKFGLVKIAEGGDFTCMVKPEVVTMALIRETSKNG
ncbi:hypothetical protein DFH06DRAFT_1000668 [Mycena polygramma]|nr:hypothetical protein DFH06DRAFT_1000668 [Mycena polygramma]